MISPLINAEIDAGATNSASVSTNAAKSVRPVDALFRAAEAAQPFRSPDGRFHVQLPVGQRYDVIPFESRALRNWLVERYRAEHGHVPSAFAIGQVLAALESRARFADQTSPVFVRVGCDGAGGAGHSDYFLDLANSRGQSVMINAQGWSIVDRPRVRFRRPDGMLPLPTPVRDGSIALLRQYVNSNDIEHCLLLGWIAAAYMSIGPYPILVIHGEQGSAKSTLTRVIGRLIDPQESPLLDLPQNTRDLVVTAYNGWLLAYDNISKLPVRMADGLCRVATGGGHSSRRSHTGDARDVVYAQRPVVLNGIDDFIQRADLADRCMVVNPPPILAGGRRGEKEFWQSFEADYPAIFGGMLSALAGGLNLLPSVQLAEAPRMADFARLGEAVGRGLGWPAGTFLDAYAENRRVAALHGLEDSVLARTLLDSASLGGLWNWTKSATEMLEELSSGLSARDRSSSGWPRSPRVFTDELRRLAPLLRTRGIAVTFTRTKHARLITIHADRSFDHSVGPHYTEALELPQLDAAG
jgi:hypothetical protein